MRYLVVLLLAACASAGEGNTCITAGYYSGDKIKHEETGRIGTVKKVYGRSARCSVPTHPILADVEY